MEKKKIAFSMKSNFAFDRVKVTYSKIKAFQKIVDIYPDNLNTFDGVEDLLDFWKPELVVLDTKLIELQRIEDLLMRQDIPVILFDSDYEALTEQLKNHFEIDEDLEEEEPETINYIKNTEHVPEKVIVKDRIVEKEILRTEYTAMNNKIIVVASLWSGAGSTTLSTNLARAIAERGLEVSYVEYPLSKPYMFDYLSIPLQENEREESYNDVAREIQETGTRKNKRKVWKQNGVNWFVTDTRKEPIQDFAYEQMLQYIYSIHSVVTIVDVSSNLHHPNIQKLLHHADEIFVCLEPDPVKIDWLSTIKEDGKEVKNQRIEHETISFLNQLEKKEDLSYHFVTMKYSPVIRKDEWNEALEKESVAYFPVIPYEELIKSVWDSTFIYDDENYTEDIEDAFKPIIVKILPRDFYQLKGKTKKKSLFNIFKDGRR